MTDRVRVAAERVRAAVENPGRRPDHHQQVIRRHREQWPALWRALDDLVSALDGHCPAKPPRIH